MMEAIVRGNAISAGARLLPLLQGPSWEGSIAAVFQSSLLCSASDGRLMHLHSGPQLLSPFSLRIAQNLGNVLRKAPVVPGMPIRKTDRAIEIAAHLYLRLDNVTYYHSPVHLAEHIEPGAVAAARQLLGTHGRPGGLDQIPGLPALVTAIRQALADRHAAQLFDAARRLVGLGPGLTPSGDDFLVGCLRGLWLIDWKEPAVYHVLSRLREALRDALDTHTTRVGAEFIRHASDGAFAEILDQAALSLLAPSHPQGVQSALSQLLAQGETSGTDTTLGLLTCLEALLSATDREPCHPGQGASATVSIAL